VNVKTNSTLIELLLNHRCCKCEGISYWLW